MTPPTTVECEAPVETSALHQQKDANHDHTSRTSLTVCDSWDFSNPTHEGGVDVNPLLGSLFGIDFLPFSPPEEVEAEEEIKVPPMDVPRSVEITPPPSVDAVPGEHEVTPVKSGSRISATPQQTEELQGLLVQSIKKKKGQRFRRLLSRVKIGKRRGGGSKSDCQPSKKKELTVDTGAASGVGQEISPTATQCTDCTLSPLTVGEDVKEEALRKQTESLRAQAEEQERNMKSTHSEVAGLQAQLAATISRYQAQLEELQATQTQLVQLSAGCEEPKVVEDVATEGSQRALKRSESGTFMRVHDLDLSRSAPSSGSLSSLSQSDHNVQKGKQKPQDPTPEFLLMDNHLLEIVNQLMCVGFDLATDETDSFAPTRDTAKLISQMPATVKAIQNGWPIEPWTPAWDQNVLVWMGKVAHKGFGHTWPVVKGRGILHTSARNVLEYLWDSSLVPKYNPLCQGRQDLYTFQEDVHMTAEESSYGFAGCSKIVCSLNKTRLLPKGIEMKVLLYARPMEQHPGSYILVSRSVWENDTATLDNKQAKTVIRTEMLMGCTILRAIDESTCEMTNLTHVHSPAAPEFLVRKASPGQCHGMMKTFQSLFPSP